MNYRIETVDYSCRFSCRDVLGNGNQLLEMFKQSSSMHYIFQPAFSTKLEMLLVSCSCYLKPFNPVSVTNVSALVSTSYYLSVALSTYLFQVESLILAAAAEGRWEAIQQAFHQPGQGAVVREARNKVSWAGQLVPSSFLPLYQCVVSIFPFTVQCSMDGPPFTLLLTMDTSILSRSSSKSAICTQTNRARYRWTVCVSVRGHVYCMCMCVGSTICQGINECENIGTFEGATDRM